MTDKNFKDAVAELIKSANIMETLPSDGIERNYNLILGNKLSLDILPDSILPYVSSVECISGVNWFDPTDSTAIKVVVKDRSDTIIDQPYYRFTIFTLTNEIARKQVDRLYERLNMLGFILFRKINETEYSVYNMSAYCNQIMTVQDTLILINSMSAKNRSLQHSNVIRLTDMEMLEVQNLIVLYHLGTLSNE